MKIKHKLTIGTVLLTLFSTIAACVGLGWLAIQSSNETLRSEAMRHMVSVREINKLRIEQYFKQINNQLLTLANDRMIIDAANGFKAATASLDNELMSDTASSMREQLNKYYTRQFAVEYNKQNDNQQRISTRSFLERLDTTGTTLQYLYIQNNRHPLGGKDALMQADDGSQYSQLHGLYHPHIRDYLKKFGYYDIFIVDPDTGLVVYSVFKEIDFATSLKNGSFAKSGLGKAFKRANKLSSPSTVLEDFEPYAPSYDSSAAFMATPIFDHGQKVAILIFQMPIDKINNIMTNNGNWESVGMGKSGESYIVGADFKTRSMSRFLIEDKAGYLQALEKNGVDKQTTNMISSKNSNIGLQSVRTKGAQAALAGVSGSDIITDYRGVSVLSAYAPLNIFGVNWAILTEIDEAEAFAPAIELQHTIIIVALTVLVAVAIISTFAATLFTNILSRPITAFSQAIEKIVAGNRIDLTQRLDTSAKDEFGELASHINHLLVKKQDAVHKILEASNQLSAATDRVMAVSTRTQQNIFEQQQQTESVATAMNEMTATVNDVARNAAQTASRANDGDLQAQSGKNDISNTIISINQLSSDISSAENVVKELEKQSNDIGSVLDVIRGIAEQTNLLALNAAIEAARAGEQGRGFAVVADEVRTLASRTQVSTEEIQSMIEKLQQGAKNSADVMTRSSQNALETAKQAQTGQQALDNITDMIAEINDMTAMIASASEEQSAVAEEINANVIKISNYAQETSEGSQETTLSSQEMQNLSAQLLTTMQTFIV